MCSAKSALLYFRMCPIQCCYRCSVFIVDNCKLLHKLKWNFIFIKTKGFSDGTYKCSAVQSVIGIRMCAAFLCLLWMNPRQIPFIQIACEKNVQKFTRRLPRWQTLWHEKIKINNCTLYLVNAFSKKMSCECFFLFFFSKRWCSILCWHWEFFFVCVTYQ